MIKWYENVDMLKEILENISKELEEVEYGSRVWYLLTDESNLIKNHLELIKENNNLKKALDKACEMLEWDCPVELDLIDDLDCENCNGTYKECWKKYCLNEAKEMKKIKGLLYCCKAKPYIMKYKDGKYKEIASFYNKQDLIDCELLNGKIIAECDFEVEKITPSTWNAETERRILKGSCLKEHQLFDYIIKGDENESQNPFYAIHIKNLHIFDKPRELSDYCTKQCQFRKCSTCRYGKNNITCLTIDTPITKAPQNMMYAYDNLEIKILISIQAEWLCKILNGEQTILIKKKVLKEMLENASK